MQPAAGDDRSPRWRYELGEQIATGVHLVRWILLGALAGALAGVASWAFLTVLDHVTQTRLDHEWLIWFLPAAGLVIGAAYHYVGGRSAQGNALLIDEIHEPTDWVPRRMAPLVLVGTWATHLFGGSAGREGTAIQMAGSLTDGASRVLRLEEDDRRMMLIAALAGGFGSVFGVPLAGAVFALEVQSIGRVKYEALVPALAASIVGAQVVRSLGYHHVLQQQIVHAPSFGTLAKIAVAGIAFGLAGAAFVELSHFIKAEIGRRVSWPPLRPCVGGGAVVGLAVIFGHDYLGLSVPLATRALSGEHLTFAVFALKLLFTAITLGCAFPGGEVTPLFVMGATLGSALAAPLGMDAGLLAAIGYVAVFAGAANTPLACTVMGAELFGSSAVVGIAVGCVVAYVFSNHRSIYMSQRVEAAKHGQRISGAIRLDAWRARRKRA
jgi:H+/Cl- antiporter ClcA